MVIQVKDLYVSSPTKWEDCGGPPNSIHLIFPRKGKAEVQTEFQSHPPLPLGWALVHHVRWNPIRNSTNREVHGDMSSRRLAVPHKSPAVAVSSHPGPATPAPHAAIERSSVFFSVSHLPKGHDMISRQTWKGTNPIFKGRTVFQKGVCALPCLLVGGNQSEQKKDTCNSRKVVWQGKALEVISRFGLATFRSHYLK